MTEKKKKTQKSAVIGTPNGGRLTAELYLKVPYRILNISGLSLAEKLLLAHIDSFGAKGCWQSNKTLAQMFMVTPRSITKYIAALRRKDLVQMKCSKGYYRTIFSKTHPEVKAAGRLWYRGQALGERVEKSANSHRKNVRADCAKMRNRVSKNLLPTNNTTIKENYKDTTATPSPPLPKGAPALLAERDKDADTQIQNFLRNFGREKKKFQPLSQQEFERRKQAQIRALLG